MTRRRLPPAEQMSPYFHEWLQWTAIYEERVGATVKSHGLAVRRLLSYSEVPPGEFGPGSFDQALLMDTVMEMKTDVDIPTIRRSIRALEAFYDFCLTDRLILQKPNFERIKLLLHNRVADGPYEFSSYDKRMPPSFREWLQWMNQYEGRSQTNIRSRSSEVRRLLSCAEISPDEFEPDNFDQALLEDTVREMKMRDKVAVATIRRSLKSLEAFYDFCLAERLILQKPNFARIENRLPKSPKAPRKPSVPRWDGDRYEDYELSKLLKAARSESSMGNSQIRWPARDHAIVSFLGVAGLRPGELVEAKISWIDEGWGPMASTQTNLRVRTHLGGRTIPLTAFLVQAYEGWMTQRHTFLGTPLDDDPLFVSRDGERLTPRRLRGLIGSLNRETGLRDRPPSALRNTARQSLVKDRVPTAIIQQLMGHRRPPR